ncbi:hypothetical protein NFC81_01080 [Salinispirillum sp. LH 10-3-1]|uniref:Uncharacterized protein n=1 Tax=Salinispirillum sp. LH 10-3-1 TaxID=2952525 RepID=A0AB38YGB6_9GAMM
MAIEAANISTSVSPSVLSGALRRDDNPALAREQEAPRPDNNTTADVQVAALSPQQTDRQLLLERVAATQIAREALNQVENSLVEQRDLAVVERDSGVNTQPEQREIQDRRGELTERQGTIFSAPERDILVDQSLRSQFVEALEVTSDAEQLASVEQLDASIETVGAVQQDLARQEVEQLREFSAQQDARLSSGTFPVRNVDEATALVERVVEAETEQLTRTSNAVDDQQRQQVLNLLTV